MPSEPSTGDTRRCCLYCGTPQREFGSRNGFWSHLVEEHPMECLDWLLDDWQSAFRKAIRASGTSTHDPIWEFTENRPIDADTGQSGEGDDA